MSEKKIKFQHKLSTFQPKGETHIERLLHLARATGGGECSDDYLNKALESRRQFKKSRSQKIEKKMQT